MRLIDVDVYCATICRCNRRECDKAKCPIHNAPTAYSVDKVVEELEAKENEAILKAPNTSDITNPEYQKWMMKSYGFKEAIEIVKQGGIADDVCEWQSASDGEFIRNPHTKRLYSNEPSMKNIYCNTCGKKIKVVEQ